ncbi:hypothetical protein [Campylobacter phage CJLB-14]|nr:hypothetical protein [Campylobacter phage CJLB-14]
MDLRDQNLIKHKEYYNEINDLITKNSSLIF